MNLKTIVVADQKPHPDNPNTHPEKQIDALGGRFVGTSFSDTFFPEVCQQTEPSEMGFVLVNGNTWLPRPLHDARRKQQRKAARKNESYLIWTR
jgi:hypothetical protein